MEFTQVLVSESFDVQNAVTEKIPVATLLIEDEYHTIYNTENVIGREISCDIVIGNSVVSSKHAVIEAEDSEAHLIYDLGSTNKTKLGKMFLKPHVRYHINDGDCVTFGNISAQYNISRKYLTPVKGNATLNSCSIPETPERLVSTLELDSCGNSKQKVESSVLELSDTDLFDEKDTDTNACPKQSRSSLSKTSSDIYELDTLSFDENNDNHVKKTDLLEGINKINAISAKNNVESIGCDEKHVSKTKNNFGWEDFPEISSDRLDSSSATNLDCPKSKISSSFLDITNVDLKSDQHTPKNVGGVILSDLCKSSNIDSNKQDVLSTSEENEFKIIDKAGQELSSEGTSIEPKTLDTSGPKEGQYLEDDCLIPLSQNIDMFEESPDKTNNECPEQDDVYEMLTQVSIENNEVNNHNNSIYDIQTQVAVANNDSESKVYKEYESSPIMPPNTEGFSILEPASQPANVNDKTESNISFSKSKVIDETNTSCSFSTSIYEAATQPFLHNVIKEPISEITNPQTVKRDQNEIVTSAVIETAIQSCINPGENDSLSTTLIEGGTQECPLGISVDPSKQSHQEVNVDGVKTSSTSAVEEQTQPSSLNNPHLLHEEMGRNSSEEMAAKESSMFDWYEIATQPCQPTSEKVAIEQESQDKELTKNNDEIFKSETLQNDNFSTSICDIATQPCPKEISPEKTESINETTLNPELSSMSDENSSFSATICGIATQPCPKELFSDKRKSVNEATLNSELTKNSDEYNKSNSFSNSVCDIATQPCQEDTFLPKNGSIDEITLNPGLTTVCDDNKFSTSICDVATQPCPKYILPKNRLTIDDTPLNPEFTTICDENNENSSCSTTICEIATQPYPKDIFPRKTESIDDKIVNPELPTIGDENNKNSNFSTSICEIATQPCPKDIFPQKTESMDDTTVNLELPTIGDENNSFSTSICEIATQPCPKVIFPQKSMDDTTVNLELPTIGDENNSFSTSICEIATQPYSTGRAEITDQYKSIKNNENISLLIERDVGSKMNVKDTEVVRGENEINITIGPKIDSRIMLPSEIIDEEDNLSLIGARTNPEILNKSVKMIKESCNDFFDGENINIFSDSKSKKLVISESVVKPIETMPVLDATITNSFFEVATQPVSCQVDLNLPSGDKNLPLISKVSEKGYEVEKALLEGPESKSDDYLDKSKNIKVTPKPDDFSLSAALPSTLSYSFFEAATQPYKNDEGQEKTFPDPLTSICNDLSDDKIGEITDELMFGNISTKLEGNNKILHNNKPSKETIEYKKNVETSDNNIFEAFTNQVSFCSQKNIVSSNTTIESMHNKMSTQDLQRILESDDHTQKYDEFKKNSTASNASDHILNTENNVGPDNRSDNLLKSETKESSYNPVPDSQALGSKAMFLDSDSSQELNIRSNKKRCNVFPPDSQSFTNKFLDNEDSSQELNFRSNKKRCNVFPPDSQSLTNKFLDNEDSSQELNIKSNKKRCNVFPPDSQDCTYKNLESASNVAEEELVKTPDNGPSLENTKSSDLMNNINNDIQKSNSGESSKIVSNTSVENNDQPSIKKSSNNNLDTTVRRKDNVLKDKLDERISTAGNKRNSKENKNKSPPERERESTYISRGNITLHSPEVLSELEEQFRLTKVAMSPTQLSVVSDIEDEINSSQEVNELDKHGIRRSIRNRKNTLSMKSLKCNKSPTSHKMVQPTLLTSNENVMKEDENKRKGANSISGPSKNEKSFKKFKKVSPMKNNSPNNEKLVKVTTNEAYAEIASCNSDNSQNSEELGRGKRKRIRTSYEGFIVEEEKKRTSRKKLSFSNSDDSQNMNYLTSNIEEINNSVLDESVKTQNNDVPSNSYKQCDSVVINTKKVLTEATEPNVEKIKATKQKTSKKNAIPHVLVDKISNITNSSTKDEAKAKQNETAKDKNNSFSFSEKLDELFNIWGPADRVKLSPRVAKKSYKLLVGGKTEPTSPITSSSKSQIFNTLDKEPKPSTSRSNKNSIKNNEKKNEAISDVKTKTSITSRKRNLSQKNEVTELPDSALKQNKKRRKTNSENSETSQEPDTNDSEVRKSSRITRKKALDVPIGDCKPEKNTTQINRIANELPKRVSNRSIESIEDSASVSNKNVKISLRNSRNVSMKPPLNAAIVNVKNKNSITKEKKNPIHIKENSSPEIHEENYCFSQEYSFHENKIQKVRNEPSENYSNLPLKIRRSGRKKNEKTAEKNVENVMFTGFADKKTRSLVSVLGGQIVESPFTCTVLVTDKVRRTTKFLSALSRGLPIVSPQWLINSNENGRFLDSSDFLLSDNEAETMFSFNLKNSIEKAQNGKVLDGWSIFVTPSVKPSPEEMKSIIECSGGRFLPKELIRWPTNSLIVSCDEDRSMWLKFSKKGKGPIIVNNEAILLGVLRQELDLESHKML